MNANLSIAQILADLEAKIGHFESQEAFHAQHEATHREQWELYAVELARVRERYDTFKAAATAAGEVVNREAASVAQHSEADARLRITTLSKLLLHVLAGKPSRSPSAPPPWPRKSTPASAKGSAVPSNPAPPPSPSAAWRRKGGSSLWRRGGRSTRRCMRGGEGDR